MARFVPSRHGAAKQSYGGKKALDAAILKTPVPAFYSAIVRDIPDLFAREMQADDEEIFWRGQCGFLSPALFHRLFKVYELKSWLKSNSDAPNVEYALEHSGVTVQRHRLKTVGEVAHIAVIAGGHTGRHDSIELRRIEAPLFARVALKEFFVERAPDFGDDRLADVDETRWSAHFVQKNRQALGEKAGPHADFKGETQLAAVEHLAQLRARLRQHAEASGRGERRIGGVSPSPVLWPEVH